jgi:predicted RNA methylase
VDTVVMNPPFGTRRKGADMEFLASALKVSLPFMQQRFPFPRYGFVAEMLTLDSK